MKVYLWPHTEGIYLVNEDKTEWCKPYFITHPQRMSILKERYNEKTMDKVDLLLTVTNEELQQMVDNAILKWKPMLNFIEAGLHDEYVAEAEIK